MASNDPQFEEKAAEIIGLYLNPPQNAAVFCWMRRVRFKHWTGWTDATVIARTGREAWVRVLPPRRTIAVESWLGKLQRDVIDRGAFTSVSGLKRKILRYIRLYQKTAKPFRWKYSDVRKRIPAW